MINRDTFPLGFDKDSGEIRKLATAEVMSRAWLVLSRHLSARLETMRAMNDRASMTESETAHLRGQIAAYKEILGLGQPDPEATETD